MTAGPTRQPGSNRQKRMVKSGALGTPFQAGSAQYPMTGSPMGEPLTRLRY